MEMAIEKEKEEAEQEKARMYIQYLSNIFSRPQQGKPDAKFTRAKKEFERLLMPDNNSEKDSKQAYEWDFDPEDYLLKED